MMLSQNRLHVRYIKLQIGLHNTVADSESTLHPSKI